MKLVLNDMGTWRPRLQSMHVFPRLSTGMPVEATYLYHRNSSSLLFSFSPMLADDIKLINVTPSRSGAGLLVWVCGLYQWGYLVYQPLSLDGFFLITPPSFLHVQVPYRRLNCVAPHRAY